MVGFLCGLVLLLADPKEFAPVTISSNLLVSAAIADNGLSAVAVDEDGRILRVNLVDQAVTTLVDKSKAIRVAISADGSEVALLRRDVEGRGAVVELYTVPFGQPATFHAPDLDADRSRLRLASNGLALSDGTGVAIWSRSEQGSWKERTPELARFAFLSNITAEGRLWGDSIPLDAAYPISLTATPAYNLGHRLNGPPGAMVLDIATSPDGKLAAVGWDSGHVHLINPQAETIKTYRPDPEPVISVSFSSLGTFVVVGTTEDTHVLRLPVLRHPRGQFCRVDGDGEFSIATRLDEKSNTITSIGIEGSLQRRPVPDK